MTSNTSYASFEAPPFNERGHGEDGHAGNINIQNMNPVMPSNDGGHAYGARAQHEQDIFQVLYPPEGVHDPYARHELSNSDSSIQDGYVGCIDFTNSNDGLLFPEAECYENLQNTSAVARNAPLPVPSQPLEGSPCDDDGRHDSYINAPALEQQQAEPPQWDHGSAGRSAGGNAHSDGFSRSTKSHASGIDNTYPSSQHRQGPNTSRRNHVSELHNVNSMGLGWNFEGNNENISMNSRAGNVYSKLNRLELFPIDGHLPCDQDFNSEKANARAQHIYASQLFAKCCDSSELVLDGFLSVYYADGRSVSVSTGNRLNASLELDRAVYDIVSSSEHNNSENMTDPSQDLKILVKNIVFSPKTTKETPPDLCLESILADVSFMQGGGEFVDEILRYLQTLYQEPDGGLAKYHRWISYFDCSAANKKHVSRQDKRMYESMRWVLSVFVKNSLPHDARDTENLKICIQEVGRVKMLDSRRPDFFPYAAFSLLLHPAPRENFERFTKWLAAVLYEKQESRARDEQVLALIVEARNKINSPPSSAKKNKDGGGQSGSQSNTNGNKRLRKDSSPNDSLEEPPAHSLQALREGASPVDSFQVPPKLTARSFAARISGQFSSLLSYFNVMYLVSGGLNMLLKLLRNISAHSTESLEVEVEDHQLLETPATQDRVSVEEGSNNRDDYSSDEDEWNSESDLDTSLEATNARRASNRGRLISMYSSSSCGGSEPCTLRKESCGVSLDFLNLLKRFFEKHVDISQINTYDIVCGPRQQTTSGADVDGAQHTSSVSDRDENCVWCISRLTRTGTAPGSVVDGDSRKSLVNHLHTEAARPLKQQLLAFAKTESEQDTETWFGDPTDYVCHAWSMPFEELVDALTSSTEKNKRASTYFWIDFCALPQRNMQLVENGAEDNRSMDQHLFKTIGSISNSVTVVVDKWRQPAVLYRRWCWFEIFIAIEKGIDLRLALPRKEYESLKKFTTGYNLNQDANVVGVIKGILSQTSFVAAKCSLQSDSSFIEDFLLANGRSLEDLDSRIRGGVLRMLMSPAEAQLKTHRGTKDAEKFLSLLGPELDILSRADAVATLAPSFTITGDNKRGLKIFDSTICDVRDEIQRKSLGSSLNLQPLNIVLARLLTSKGRMLGDLFDPAFIDQAVQSLQQAIEVMHKNGDHVVYLQQYFIARPLVNHHLKVSRRQHATRNLKNDLKLAKEMLASAVNFLTSQDRLPSEFAAILVHLAKVYDLEGSHPIGEVDSLFNQALDIQIRKLGKCDARIGMTKMCRGTSLLWNARYANALDVYTDAIYLMERGSFAGNAPASYLISTLCKVSMCYDQLCKEKDAEVTALRADECRYITSTAEPIILKLLKHKRSSLEAKYLMYGDLRYWVMARVKRILVLDSQSERLHKVKFEMEKVCNLVDTVSTLEGAVEKVSDSHIYAAVIMAEDFPLTPDNKLCAYLNEQSQFKEKQLPYAPTYVYAVSRSTANVAAQDDNGLHLIDTEMHKLESLPKVVREYLNTMASSFWDQNALGPYTPHLQNFAL